MKMTAKKLAKLLSANKQLLIGLGVGMLIAVPMGVMAMKNNDSKKDVQTEVKASSQPSSGNSAETQSTTPTTTTSTPGTGTSPSPKSTQTTTKPTTPGTSTTPSASTPTPTPTPTELSSCVYQNGSKAGLPCPYNPPYSWSTNSQVNPCVSSTGSYAPCSEYRSTVSIWGSIETEGYNEFRYLCNFTFSNNNHRRVTVGAGGGWDNMPDCSTMYALDYDPYAGQ